MTKAQGNGLRAWQASLTPEKRKEIAKKGGIARGKKLSATRRKEISMQALKMKAAYKRIRNQAVTK